MDKIRFDVAGINSEQNMYSYNTLYPLAAVTHISINDINLLSLVREAELPFATQMSYPDMAGGLYTGLKPSKMLWPSRHLLGDPEPQLEDEGKIVIYNCICGQVFCWSLLVRIVVGKTAVTWSDFEQPHRGPGSAAGHWRYDALGPFTFDRQQYESALEVLW